MKYFSTLHFLRGIFTILVLLCHVNGAFGYSVLFHGAFLQGACGVDFFFVLSGFLIVLSCEEHHIIISSYLRKRFFRIFPAYWVYTIIGVILTAFVLPVVNWIHVDFWGILRSLFCIPTDIISNELPILPTAWTLPYQLIQYLFALFLLKFGIRGFQSAAAVWITMIAAYNGAVFSEIFSPPVGLKVLLDVLFSTMHLEFLSGAGMAFLIRHKSFKASSGVLLTLSGLLFLFVLWIFCPAWVTQAQSNKLCRVLTWGIASAILIMGVAVTQEKFSFVFLKKWHIFGDASYSIYLTHFLTLHYGNAIFYLISFPENLYLRFCILVVLCTAVGIVAYFTVERPLYRLFSRFCG